LYRKRLYFKKRTLTFIASYYILKKKGINIMKNKKAIALILINVLALGVMGVLHSLRKNGLLGGVDANPLSPAYTRTLTALDGPNGTMPMRGTIVAKDDTYYYSSASSQNDDSFLVLSASDAKNPGVFMNTTVINGIGEVRVTFSGSGNLYAIVSETLFERFTPSASDALTSGVKKEFATVGGYLLILNDSLSPITIESLEIYFHCAHDIDSKFYFEQGVNLYTGARSLGSNIVIGHDELSFKTNPTATTNNYAGETIVPPAERPNAWYRWNGVSMRNYGGTLETPNYTTTRFGEFYSSSFKISTTAFVDPSVFYDTDEWFCVAPWVSLSASGKPRTERHYLQSYIGNDNYDPLTTVNELYKPYFSGRFYTNYGYTGSAWEFQDPDTVTVVDDATMTLREAYEAINLPFFNVTYEISGNTYKVFINGFYVYTDTILETYTDETFALETFELQAVNYGNEDGSPKAGYNVTYSNPVIKTI